MKQLTALQRRSNSFRNAEANADGSVKSPSALFWLVIHGLCCLISLVLGFRFSRLVFFLLFSPTSTTIYTTSIQTSGAAKFPNPLLKNTTSRVVVGRHGILIRPWPHPDPKEVMKAHRIIDRVQKEQRAQFGVKNPRTVIAVTPTYVRTFQALHLTGVMHTLMNLEYDVVWVVVEANGVSNETASILNKSGLRVFHVGFEGNMPVLWEDRHRFESRMRIRGLRVVREQRMDGIVVFMDDSNMHSLELFDEIQSVRWIGAVSIGILAHSGGAEEGEFTNIGRDNESDERDNRRSQVPVQGPACNSSNHLIGWHTFNTAPFVGRSARHIGDRGVVLPRKLEWAGFVLNSRLVWDEEDSVERPMWARDLEEFDRDGGEDVESPLSLLKDASSVVEPLGSCGRKVLLWWLRVEARADSKFPAGWIIDPPLDITVPAKRTPWPDAPPELPIASEKVVMNVQENTERRAAKTGSRKKRTSRSKKKRAAKVLEERVSMHQSDRVN